MAWQQSQALALLANSLLSLPVTPSKHQWDGYPAAMTVARAQSEEEADTLATPDPAHTIADQEISVGAEKAAD